MVKKFQSLQTSTVCAQILNFNFVHCALLKIDSHVSSGATRWATGWSIGQDGPAGKAAFCLLSEPEQRWVVLVSP